MSISAMKQALEALVEANEISKGPYAICLPAEIDTAMDALRQAIAEAEKIVPSDYPNSHQQEPFAVAWVLDGELFWPSEYEVIAQAGDKAIPLYAAPVYASDISQERVDETAKRGHELAGTIPISNGGIATRTPSSFISPPQRHWVGLTDGDVHDAFNFVEFVKQISFDRDRPEWCENFAAYLEAKLKEKNHG